jgi:predicted PolB exonuclease-like 3'-5' exonuclease
MSNAVIVWDLETVPDVEALSRIHLVKPQQARASLGTDFPKLPVHRIVCIGALVALQSEGAWHIDALGAPHVGDRSEGDLISAFVEKVAALKPILVSYNGTFFDLPVLRYRAMVNSVSAPGLYSRNYFARYAADAVDLCDVLSSFNGSARVSLDQLCKTLSLPGKSEGIKGSDVEDYVSNGRIREVAEYCESDVVNTFRIWLRYELFRGSLDREGWERSEAALRTYVLQRSEQRPHFKNLL